MHDLLTLKYQDMQIKDINSYFHTAICIHLMAVGYTGPVEQYSVHLISASDAWPVVLLGRHSGKHELTLGGALTQYTQ